jgi:hypothetical protein
VFFIEYDDWRHILKTDNRPLAVRRGDLDNIRIDTFGGHTLHAFESRGGTFDLLLWGAVQTGRWGSQKQRAGAFDIEGGFQPKILPKARPWLRAGFTWGSGDGNPNDNTHGTFFQLLPTPRPYARFPFFNMMNTEDRFGAMILRPHPKVTISSEFHSLHLSDANDFWYSGGGAYQTVDFRIHGAIHFGPPVVGESLRYQRRISGHPACRRYGICWLHAGSGGDGADLSAGEDGKFGYLELLYRL